MVVSVLDQAAFETKTAAHPYEWPRLSE